MTPATQPCTAMVELDHQTAMSEGQYERPCGELVAELGPCLVSGSAEYPDEWRCNWPPDEHNAAEHDYQGRLVHVTLGPCEECGEGQEKHRCAWPELCQRHHPYAPTVTERTMEHEAEVSDG